MQGIDGLHSDELQSIMRIRSFIPLSLSVMNVEVKTHVIAQLLPALKCTSKGPPNFDDHPHVVRCFGGRFGFRCFGADRGVELWGV